MNADWQEYRLGDLTDWYSGGTPSKKIDRYWNGTIPWISASSMSGSRYNDSELKITEDGLQAGSRLVPEETLLLLVRGSSLHQRIPVGISLCPVAFNQDVKAIRIKEEVLGEDILDPWYLLYWFISKESYLLGIVENTGIGAGKFDTKQLQDLTISIPPKNEREFIVAIAKSIDEKAELNRQVNQTLEEMAQAIFKSWFVYFEPVNAKIEAKANGQDQERAAMCVISGKTDAELDNLSFAQFTQLRNTAALFPDELTDSDLGVIPKGWEVKKIKDWGAVVCGKTPSKKDASNYGGDVPFIKIPDMHGNVYATRTSDKLSAKGASTQPNKKVLSGSICVSCIATVGQVVLASEDSHTNQQINTIVPDKMTHNYYLFFSMKERKGLLHELASGGSATLNLNTGNFSKIPLLYPNEPLLDEFFKKVYSSFEIILLNDKQSQVLENIRDTLLPKLLSGEIELSQVA